MESKTEEFLRAVTELRAVATEVLSHEFPSEPEPYTGRPFVEFNNRRQRLIDALAAFDKIDDALS